MVAGEHLHIYPSVHVGLVGQYTVGMCKGAPLGSIGNNVPNFTYTNDTTGRRPASA